MSWCWIGCSVTFLSLSVVSRPLQLTRISLERQCADSASARAEVEYGSVVLHVHYARGVRKALSAEGTLERLWRRLRLYLIFFASLSVSRSMRTSLSLIGPLTFLVIIRPLSRPSNTLTRTWMTSPVTPVRPITCVTSAGMSGSSDLSFPLLTSLHRSS